MTIDEAIKERIDRFNKLWKNAVGYTFEEEPEALKESNQRKKDEWNETLSKYEEKYGFKDDDSFMEYLGDHGFWDEGTPDIPQEVEDLFRARPKYESSLYPYEMTVIRQARSIAEFVEERASENGITPTEQWDRYVVECGPEATNFGFVKVLESYGYTGWSDGHSGNTAAQSLLFALTLVKWREDFKYLHGAMAGIVGDAGYHDDRGDVREHVKNMKNGEEQGA